MLSAYLFDEQEGKKLETWVDALDDVGEGQLLWLDLVEASADEEREVGEALGLDEVDAGRFRKRGVQACARSGQGVSEGDGHRRRRDKGRRASTNGRDRLLRRRELGRDRARRRSSGCSRNSGTASKEKAHSAYSMRRPSSLSFWNGS